MSVFKALYVYAKSNLTLNSVNTNDDIYWSKQKMYENFEQFLKRLTISISLRIAKIFKWICNSTHENVNLYFQTEIIIQMLKHQF